MNLKALKQNELDLRMKALAKKEREVLHEVLETLKEIDARKSYVEFGFASLFEYLVQGVGYSEGSAQRRIDAARLLRELPVMAEKIQSGEINLSQISLLQKAVREVTRTRDIPVTTEEKMEILESLGKKSFAQTQQQVAAFFDLPVTQATHQKVQADESVRIELTLSKDAFAKIKNAQELLSHAVSSQDLAVFLEYLADKVIKQKTGLKNSGSIKSPPAIPNHEQNVIQNPQSSSTIERRKETPATAAETSLALKKRNSSARIASVSKKLLLTKQPCCQWVDPQSGRQCKSKWLLQVDHKQSRWAKGDHSVENLQILCAAHNKLKYQREAGVRNIS